MENKHIRQRFLLENWPDAFARHQAIGGSNGKTADYLFLYINRAFAEMTGLTRESLIGKKLTELPADINKLFSFDWFELYEKVASTGATARLEGHVEIADRCYDVTASCDEPGCFTTFFHDITALKREEKELRSERDLYASILRFTPLFMVIIDHNGRILKINEVMLQATNYHSHEVLGKDYLKTFIPPDEQEKVSKIFHTLSESEEPTVNENFVLTRDGKKLLVEWHGVPFYKEDGTLDFFYGLGIDITRRKQAEEALRTSEEKYKAAFEGSDDAIVLVTKDEFIDCNQRAVELFELDKKEKFRMSRPAHFSPSTQPDGRDSIALSRQIISESLEKGYAKFEWLFQSTSGRIFPAEVIHTVYSSGEKKFLLATIRDITARKEIEKALQKSEERYRLLVNNANEAIVIAQDGMHKFVNPKAVEFYGYPAEVLTSTPFLEFTHPEDKEQLFERYQKRISREISQDKYTFRIIAGDGRIKWAEVNTTSVDWEGRPAALTLINDITERKQAEEKVRYMSFHDRLTGLHNRHYLEEEMQRLDTARQLPISIIMADLNGLKLINDTYGHSTGDELLRSTAHILRHSCRREDIIARWGGDEFVILLPRASAEIASSICLRINENCSQTYVEEIPVSISLGAAQKDRTEKSLLETLKDAEDDMYKQKLSNYHSARSAVLSALLKTLGAKSFETEQHTLQMQNIAFQIGERLGLPEAELNRLSLLITLHDIGKINIPEKILTKIGPLTAEEWETVKKHPESGCRIARAMEEFAHVAEDILAHHEHWDGTGYPQGLKGEEVPLLARIAAIADAYEVMRSGRPYKAALSEAEIVAELKRCAGTQLDPGLVKILLSILEADS